MTTECLQDANPRAMIELERVERRFAGNVHVLDRISLSVQSGEFVALTGPSGCGKTTLLRLVAGLDRPTAGRIVVGEARVAYCFQDARLLPWRTLQRNVELPLELDGVESGERASRARAALERVGLGDATDRLPNACSGGMVMRASVARALVVSPDLLLLDEPFGALDEVTREELDEMLLRLWETDRMTVLLVTHSIREAVFLSQRVVVLGGSPGRVIEDCGIDLRKDDPDLRTGAAFNEQIRRLQLALQDGASTSGGRSDRS